MSGIPCPTCHRGGAVTWWDPVAEAWVLESMDRPSPEAFAAMPTDEAARVRRHRWRWLGDE